MAKRPPPGWEDDLASELESDSSREAAAAVHADVQAELNSAQGQDQPVRPLANPRAWVLLAGIFVLIAVAVLYVYQAGDTKTILGNQPIPESPVVTVPAPVGAYGEPTAFNVAGGGLLTPHPKPSPVTAPRQNAAAPVLGLPPVAPDNNMVSPAHCPACGDLGVPLCSICGAVMQPVPGSANSGIFVCPHCGLVGAAVCPHCGGLMLSGRLQPHVHTVPQGSAAIGQNVVGGQFQCPVCGATGLPNWEANGTPHCPNCGALMSNTSQVGVVRPGAGALPPSAGAAANPWGAQVF